MKYSLSFPAVVACVCLTSVVAGRAAAQAAAARTDHATAAATITAPDVLRHLGVIADDSMRGRDTPSRGLDLTAGYIAAQFRAFGLRPAGDSGSFIQHYPYAVRRLSTSTRMIELKADSRFNLAFGRDYFVVPSDENSVEGTPYYAGVVNASFAIPTGVRAPIVVAAIPDTMDAAWGERFNKLLFAAATSGAKAIIIILDPKISAASIAEMAEPASQELAPIMVFGVRDDAFTPVLQAGHVDRTRASLMTGASLHLSTSLAMSDARVPNVVGILRGSDPVLRDEYVVFSAHMDHVGVGAPDARNDSIYNGADDDGSGTTAIIELAHAFSTLGVPPARSMIFLTVSGEEKGLLGSSYFTDHLPVPAAKIVADINIDMIGRNNPDSVTAIGMDYTSLGRVAITTSASHPELHLTVAADMQPEEHLFERSDHFNFARKDIPAIFFTSGLHKDYHKPSDDVSAIDAEKLARVARLAFYLGAMIADTPERPLWTKLGQDVVRAARGGTR